MKTRALSHDPRARVPCLALVWLAACGGQGSDPADDGGGDAGVLDGGHDAGDALDAREDTSVEPPDADGADQVCPVVGYSPCGGELLGTWSFLELCPEDPEAAAALCESPYDDRAECVGEGNLSLCGSTKSGTFEFRSDGTVVFETEIAMTVTWHYTDACLDAVRRESTPEERCQAIANEHVSCEYSPNDCVCISDPMVEPDEGSGMYAVTDNEVVIGDDPPATYCVDGNRLIMDYYLFHPVSWRYWVLERS